MLPGNPSVPGEPLSSEGNPAVPEEPLSSFFFQLSTREADLVFCGARKK